ncbi:MAG: hypothetical protein NZ553_18095 [Caldilinea sp.]|nr:hypothetical protein [Caldilinea sp.]MDW8442395.1 hypothetical protein [Caldilineaceae bacterium]
MKLHIALIVLYSLLALCACSPISAPAATSAEPLTIPRAVVKEFLVEPLRSILLAEAIDGITRVWLDESGSDGHFENKTQTYSVNGCPLAGSPLQAGDAIKVIGRLDETSGRLIAETIWMLNIHIEDACTGPPAE